MSLGAFSSEVGFPQGAFDRLSNNSLSKSVEVIRERLTEITTIINNGGTGTAPPFATVDDDGTVLVSDQIASASRVATGVYEVSANVAFQASGAYWRCVPLVTPMGFVANPGEILTKYYKMLYTTAPNQAQSSVQYYQEGGEVWATDNDYTVSGSSYDRIGILRPESNTWTYLNLNETNYIQQYGSAAGGMFVDNTNGLMFIQANDVSNNVSTLIYDCASKALLLNVRDSLGGLDGGQFEYVVGIDPANETCVILDNNAYDWRTTTNGIPDATSSGEFNPAVAANSYKPVMADTAGNYWNTHDDNIYKWVFGGGETAYSTGADKLAPGLVCYRASNNTIYYMSQNGDYIKSFACTDQTITRLNGSAWGTVSSEATALTSLKGIQSLDVSKDGTRLIATRGGSATYYTFYIIDPSDGSIEAAYTLPSPWTYNWYSRMIAISDNRIWTLGTERIMEVTWTGAQPGDPPLVYKPVVANSRMVTASKARVEIFEVGNSIIRRDTPFHIGFFGLT
jgi:hypothetical protein